MKDRRRDKQQEYVRLASLLRKCEEEIASLRSEQADVDERLRQLRVKIRRDDLDAKNLENRVADMAGEVSDDRERLCRLRNATKDVERVVGEKIEQETALQMKCARLKRSLEETKNVLVELSDGEKNLAVDVETAEGENEQARSDALAEPQKLSALESQFNADISEIKSKIEDRERLLAHLESELDVARGRLERLKRGEVAQDEESIDTKAILERKITVAESRCAELKSELTTRSSETLDMQSKLREDRKVADTLASKISAAERNVERRKEEHATSMRERKASLSKVEKETELLRKRLVSANEERETMDTSLRAVMEEAGTLKEKIRSGESETRQLIQQEEELKRLVADSGVRVSSMSDSARDLRLQLEEHLSQCLTLRKKLQISDSMTSVAEGKLEEEKEASRRIDIRMKEAKTSVAVLTADIKSRENEFERDSHVARQKIAEMRSSIVECVDKSKSLAVQSEAAEAESNRFRSELAAADSEAAKQRNLKHRTFTDERESVDSVRRELNETRVKAEAVRSEIESAQLSRGAMETRLGRLQDSLVGMQHRATAIGEESSLLRLKFEKRSDAERSLLDDLQKRERSMKFNRTSARDLDTSIREIQRRTERLRMSLNERKSALDGKRSVESKLRDDISRAVEKFVNEDGTRLSGHIPSDPSVTVSDGNLESSPARVLQRVVALLGI
eukprot:g2188.t1